MTTWMHKWKCLNCSLHAAALSWNEDWRPGICPECAVAFGAVLIFDPEEVDQEIFEIIPGKQALKEFNQS